MNSKFLAAVSFLAGLGLGLLLLGGGEQQLEVQDPSLTMALQPMQATRAVQPTMARPNVFARHGQFMQPVAATVRDDAPVIGRREAMAAGVAGFMAASRPVFAAEAAPAPAPPPTIAAFPVKGDPKASLDKISSIVTKSFGTGKVMEKTPTSIKAKLITMERVKTSDLKEGEKLTVGEQRIEKMWKDYVDFKYNAGTNAIDVSLNSAGSKPGYGEKIVESFRTAYLGGPKPVGELFMRQTAQDVQKTPTRIMRKGGEGVVMPKGLS